MHVVHVCVDYVYIDNIYKYKKIRSNGLEMSHLVHSDKMMANGLVRNQLGPV